MKRSNWTPRTKGGLKITHADGTTETVASNHRETQQTIRAGEHRAPRTKHSWRYLNAKYDSTCPTCHKPINILDPIIIRTGQKARHRTCHKQGTARH